MLKLAALYLISIENCITVVLAEGVLQLPNYPLYPPLGDASQTSTECYRSIEFTEVGRGTCAL